MRIRQKAYLLRESLLDCPDDWRYENGAIHHCSNEIIVFASSWKGFWIAGDQGFSINFFERTMLYPVANNLYKKLKYSSEEGRLERTLFQ
jgi:hypothetical protein